MQLSTKADYGLRALLDIALHANGRAVSLPEIARRQEISSSYLEQLLLSLQTAGLVRSTRGRKGGFTLTKLPSEIKLYIVLRSLERTLIFRDCVDNPGICHRQKHCAATELMRRLTEVFIQELNAYTLDDLMKWHEEKNAGEQHGRRAISHLS